MRVFRWLLSAIDTRKAKRAFMQRDIHEEPLLLLSPNEFRGRSMEEVHEVRWRNSRQRLAALPSLADVVAVCVWRTSDTGELIVELRDVDNKSATLWLTSREEGRSPVRTITGPHQGPRYA